jgi:D-sedoheptulose 7-phosphate isomerase
MTTLLEELLARRPDLAVCRAEMEKVFAMMAESFRQGGKMLICGNGGSAADADHWASELLKGFAHKRPISKRQGEDLPKTLRDQLQGAFPAISLTGFSALTTAFANDVNPDLVFAQLVWALGRPGDILVGLSTSGNSRNICAAMEAARAKKMRCIGLTGESGGKLLGLADHCLRVPATKTFIIQEMHLALYHCLTFMLEEEFFPAQPA